MNAKVKTALYWTTTALGAFALTGSGLANLTRQPMIVESYAGMGYPSFLALILGAWKVAGAATLVVPRFPVLKEWAYAGITFAMTGAFASHVLHGDPFGRAFPPLLILAFILASYVLRPADRRVQGAFALGA